MAEVTKICLTGGPCGGKTSALPFLTNALEEAGYRVVVVPEMATLMLTNGISLSGPGADQVQVELLKGMMSLEDAFVGAAEAMGGKTVVICDRGSMDISSFVSPESWNNIRNSVTGSDLTLRQRYNGVFHMVTAADGAEEHYTKLIAGTNISRVEDAARAREVDQLTQQAWVGHHHLRVIPNRQGFQMKLDELKRSVYALLDDTEIERKFLVRMVYWPADLVRVTSDIEQTYLKDGSRIRSRDGAYTKTRKVGTGLSRSEVEIKLDECQHSIYLLNDTDPTRETIRKWRTTFLYDGQYFELDEFHDRHKGLWILEIELDRDDQEVRLPPWVDVVKEVTGDAAYSNSSLALKS